MKSHIRKAGTEHLQRVDPVLCAFIQRAGPCTLKRKPDHFQSLAQAILAQQVSATVAAVFKKRVEALCQPDPLSPAAILRIGNDALRGAGCSRAKAAYLLDLAAKVERGELPLERIARLPDAEITEKLVAVKGIGVWTAKMFLIFSLGRPDVFPHEDLAVRTGMQKIYKMRKLPNRARAESIAKKWKPYATVGAWYCWRWHYLEGNYKPKQ